ncbi:hypothetical protein GJW-30_1_02266 [Variibacter gotjawalensis]|uniref:DUF3551 domain-containing protein n=1 Tax=Variibacter gotjawalensis TaxID=1333996 RepID=A0A0S3PUS5_9BRAD|nr:hypothetical protein [Variibacter gotjawalensis]NIK50059.1 hypothetical protein [Variibacter gotjawalensis]RZS46058.1 hypothetical protein EV661_4384 [Variibacter gotjawalensis]BAT59733.1 hypothetical protein GJW-30_1_02266 [Variibacter gotjawalensis]
MTKIALSAALAATALFFSIPTSEAAQWCRDGASGSRCGFTSYKQCTRGGADCYRAASARDRSPTAFDGNRPAPRFQYPNQIEPTRPYWSSPYQCFTDDGGGRFRPCDQPAGGGFS